MKIRFYLLKYNHLILIKPEYNLSMRYSQNDFEKLYNTLRKPIGIYVFSKVKQIDDAQDIMQNIMLALFKAIKKGHDIQDLEDYTYKIARSELSRFYKVSIEEQVLFEDDIIDEHEQLHEDTLNHVSEALIWKEIKHLDHLTQQALILKYKYDLSYSQMAKQLNMSSSTLKYKVAQAIIHLQEKFK
jgi:RNA polymerase sigma-70 factor, ECF subfamily